MWNGKYLSALIASKNNAGLNTLALGIYCILNAPVKLFCPDPPGQPRGQRKNMFDEKGRGTGKWNEEKSGQWKRRD